MISVIRGSSRKTYSVTLVFGIATLAVAIGAAAQQPVIYPAKGQSAAQQNRDQGECHVWAKNSTGVDPAVVARQPVPQETGPAAGGGERVRGAARGAVGGAIIGEVAGNNGGEGAAAGAVLGTMRGGREARHNQAARNQQAQGQQQQTINVYHRAYSACMEGRGYTIR